MRGNDELILQINNELNASETIINAGKQLLNTGDIPITDFINAIKTQIDIKSQLNQAELKKLLLINELNYWNW